MHEIPAIIDLSPMSPMLPVTYSSGGRRNGWWSIEDGWIGPCAMELRACAQMCIYVRQMCSAVRYLCIYVRPCAAMCRYVQFNPGHDAARSVCQSGRCPLFSALLLAWSIRFQTQRWLSGQCQGNVRARKTRKPLETLICQRCQRCQR